MVENDVVPMHGVKRIALVAHDAKKKDLLEWADFNQDFLSQHELFATGTTGELLNSNLGLNVTRLKSGPAGGDAQISAMIAEGDIDFVVFFIDPMESHVHDVDIKALLRIAVVYNIPIACTRSTADFVVSSPLMDEEYERLVADYAGERYSSFNLENFE